MTTKRKKLHLDIDALRVDSFQSGEGEASARGTVHARDAMYTEYQHYNTCGISCVVACRTKYDVTCGIEC